MADAKISALTNLTAADPTNDMIPIVDVSDTPPASGNTKRISINNILSSSPTASGALTVTGLVTAGSATITGDLTARTTGLTVNSSGVGVGTSSQSSFLGNSPKKLVIGDGTQTPALTLYGGSAAISGIYFADGTVGNEAYRGFIEYDHATEILNFGTFGGSSMTVNASRNLAFPTGKGIDFSAVTGGTGTATGNVLNDYEEGTFTPTIVGQTTAGLGVYSNQVGKYTKVGNLVTVEFLLAWTAHTGTGNMLIGGLPFNSSSFANLVGAAAIGYIDGIAVNAGSIPLLYVLNAGAFIAFVQTPTGGGAVATVPIDVAGTIVVTATYQA